MLDDEDYPAYTVGRAAQIVGVSQDFLRRPGAAKQQRRLLISLAANGRARLQALRATLTATGIRP
jgi:hypothetical protein